jgi:hypothetical protein
LDACVFISIHMCWSGLECNLVQFHSNPVQHIWIEINTCVSKQGLRWLWHYEKNLFWKIF